MARNLINACAVVCFALGATIVAYGGEAFSLTGKARLWHWIVAAVVFSTLQIQDLCDQKGDKHRGRSTIPILFGDTIARWSVIVPMVFWSYSVPYFWVVPWQGYLVPLGVGGVICCRVLILKDAENDRITYKMWGLWLACLLETPFVASLL